MILKWLRGDDDDDDKKADVPPVEEPVDPLDETHTNTGSGEYHDGFE